MQVRVKDFTDLNVKLLIRRLLITQLVPHWQTLGLVLTRIDKPKQEYPTAIQSWPAAVLPRRRGGCSATEEGLGKYMKYAGICIMSDANFLLVFYSKRGLILLSFRDMITQRATDRRRQQISQCGLNGRRDTRPFRFISEMVQDTGQSYYRTLIE